MKRAITAALLTMAVVIPITGWLLERIAARLGVVALEEPVMPEDFRFFDGCFLASTTNDLVPVSSIDEHRFGLDDLSLVWKLKAGFQNYASEYAAAHPELRAGSR